MAADSAGVPQNLATTDTIPLFKRLPTLEKRIPRLPILEQFTPHERLTKLEQDIASQAGLTENPFQGRLTIKRDDLSSNQLGGNKARKLEFLIGQAKQNRATTLVTSGMWGSNHALATAVAAKQNGLKATMILGPQPLTENVRQKLLSMHTLGANLRFHSHLVGMGFDIAKYYIKAKFSGGNLYYIPSGGSSERGELGYVNAFLELSQQVGLEQLPERIVVPVGTMGTAAGLLVGSCIAGVFEKVQIVGIGIAMPLLSNERSARKEAKKLHRFIRNQVEKSDRVTIPDCDYDSEKAFSFVTQYYSPGYGAAKPVIFETIDRVNRLENIHLDRTYSGKAMQFIIDEFSASYQKKLRPPSTLFWLTYNSHDLNDFIDPYPWKNFAEKWRELPSSFWQLFSGELPLETNLDPSASE